MNGDPIDRQTAEQNLRIIVNDTNSYGDGLADTNAGWCYVFAPIRSFLTNPAFIKSLKEYKRGHFVNGKHRFNIDFLRAFFGNIADREAEQCLWIIHLLCRATDNAGKIVNTRLIHDLAHQIFPNGATDDYVKPFSLLTKSMMILNEGIDTIWPAPTNMLERDSENVLENLLNNGEVVTIGIDGNHIFNIYKRNGRYFTTGSNHAYNSLEDFLQQNGNGGVRLGYAIPQTFDFRGFAFDGQWSGLGYRDLTEIVRNLERRGYLTGQNHRNPVEEINEIADAMYQNKRAYENETLNEENYNTVISQLIDRMDVVKRANQNNANIINLAEWKMNQALSGLNPNQ